MSEGYYTVFYTSGNFSGYNIINVRKFAGNATYLEQLLINLDNEKIGSRVCRGGTWRNWHTITYNADLGNLQSISLSQTSDKTKNIQLDANKAYLVFVRHNGNENAAAAIVSKNSNAAGGNILVLSSNSNISFSVNNGVLTIMTTLPYWGYNIVAF